MLCRWLVAKSCLTLLRCHGVALLTPLSVGFPRQESRNGLPFSPPGDLPDPGIEPESPVFPTLQADSLPADVSRKKIFSLLFLSFMLKILIVKLFDIQFSSVQSFSHVRLFATP